MQNLRNKSMAILIALFMIISMSASVILQPTAKAHSPAWTIVSYAYIVAAPNPVGVGQTVAIDMWIDAPLPSAALGNGIRRANYGLTITAPDGTVSTQTWANVTDPTGVQYYQYTPTQVGTYKLAFNYPQQTYIWSGTYQGDIVTAANATQNLNVQQTPIPTAIDSYPLPTSYWTYPIEGQNTYWYTISSNWLGTPYTIGANAGNHGPGGSQPYGIAPNSAHIMWTKPIQYGGVVAGNDTAVPGEMYYGGLSYNGRFANPLIMYGTLYYQEPLGESPTGGDYVAVDLRTGQELWRINASATGTSLVPSFGYLYALETPNQHGVLPNGLLIATASVTNQGTVWRGYDPRTGVLTAMNVTNVPSGTNIAGPSGEYLKYVLTNLGNTTVPKWYLMQWNSSDVFGGAAGTAVGGWYTGTENASLPSCYDWNVSLPFLSGTGWTVGGADNNVIPMIDLGNIMLLIQGTFGDHAGFAGTITTGMTTDPANITAISLKPQSLGQVLWTKSFQQAPGNVTRTVCEWDPANGVFIFEDKETMTHIGYSLADGSQLWSTTASASDFTAGWNYFSLDCDALAYGKLYYFGYSGILYAYDDKTGNLLWTYGNGGEGNSTNSEFETAYGHYPILVSAIADGKVYLDTTEHSPNSPLFKGALLRAINATNGSELWTIFDWGNIMYGGITPIADGYLIALNTYDMQIYSYGRGPSALTVEAPMADIVQGSGLVIRGSVIDVSAGTQQSQQKANFPYGVPAVSDASQSAWMEYVYMQKPKPTTATGVPVSIDVIDSNGNYRNIGTATSDTSGAFSLHWTPDITGKYTVIATFAGSQSYWSSSAETSFAVDPAAPTASPYPVVNLPPTDMYIAAAAIAIIVAIAIVGAIMLIAIKKRP